MKMYKKIKCNLFIVYAQNDPHLAKSFIALTKK